MPFLTRLFSFVAIIIVLSMSTHCNRRVQATGTALENNASRMHNKVDFGPIYFDYYKTVLKPEAMSQLFKIGAFLKTNESHVLFVEGHSDDGSSEPYEKWLAAERVKEVTTWLIRYGPFAIRENRIVLKPGEEDQKASTACGADKNCHAKNRRVDLVAAIP